jgi:hypothetical protein
MVAAITVVPAIILTVDTIDMKNIFRKLMNNLKVRT